MPWPIPYDSLQTGDHDWGARMTLVGKLSYVKSWDKSPGHYLAELNVSSVQLFKILGEWVHWNYCCIVAVVSHSYERVLIKEVSRVDKMKGVVGTAFLLYLVFECQRLDWLFLHIYIKITIEPFSHDHAYVSQVAVGYLFHFRKVSQKQYSWTVK